MRHRLLLLTTLLATFATTPQHANAATLPRIGDSIVLRGFEGLRMKVTVLGIMRDVAEEEDDPFDDTSTLCHRLPDVDYRGPSVCGTASAATEYVGVRVALRNVGKRIYKDSPSNGAELVTRAGERANSSILVDGDCDSEWASSTTIFPGDRQKGCIAFEVRRDARLSRFHFTLNSGFANETGRWSLVKKKRKK